MKTFWEILFRREHLGYILGVLTVFAAYELDTTWLALVIVCLMIIGWPLVKKFGT